MSNPERRKVESAEAPKAIGAYSPAIKSAAASYLFISGQIGIDGNTGEFVSDTVEGQAQQCLRNLLAIVRSAGGSEASVVKTTIYLRRIEDFSTVNRVYSDFFIDPYPARACIGGCELPKDALVEIEAIAQLER
jgi:2-iminobutanoate/2-iminopropanoate deaminase